MKLTLGAIVLYAASYGVIYAHWKSKSTDSVYSEPAAYIGSGWRMEVDKDYVRLVDEDGRTTYWAGPVWSLREARTVACVTLTDATCDDIMDSFLTDADIGEMDTYYFRVHVEQKTQNSSFERDTREWAHLITSQR